MKRLALLVGIFAIMSVGCSAAKPTIHAGPSDFEKCKNAGGSIEIYDRVDVCDDGKGKRHYNHK
jgi:hypothetical protein